MIQTFGDKGTEAIFHGQRPRGVSAVLAKTASRKLDMINLSTDLEHLRAPPGNRLEKLSGNLVGFYSIRVNDQFRIVFRWQDGHAHEVRLTDYH